MRPWWHRYAFGLVAAFLFLLLGVPAVHARADTFTDNAAPAVPSVSQSVQAVANNAVPRDGGGPDVSGGTTVDQASSQLESVANAQLDSLPTQSIDRFWRGLEQQYANYLPDVSGQGLLQSVVSGGGFSFNNVVHGLLRYFLSEVLDNTKLLGEILILSVLAAILESLQTAFENQAVSQVAYTIVFLTLMVLAIGSFTEAIGYGQHAIQSMTDFMLSTVPLMVTLMAASGAVASAAFFQPVLLFSVHLISNIVFLFVFPLIFFAAILDIASSLSPRYQLTKLAGLLRKVGVAVLGLCLSAFIGVSSVQGLGKGVADGVAMRTAKFAADTFIPVIGKAVSSAADTIASASMLVKNAVGIVGLIVVAFIALFPALKILALSFIYSGSAALMQPLGDSPLVNCLGSLSKSLLLVFASVAAVALMFFISICMMLVAANLAVMYQ